MYKTKFLHHNICFGIVVDGWGDCAAGARIAADQLEEWVRNLSPADAKAIHADLVKSDEAYGGDPVFETPQMLAYFEARTAAERTGMAAGGADANDGHCNLCPL
jgi:hypothetical protein